MTDEKPAARSLKQIVASNGVTAVVVGVVVWWLGGHQPDWLGDSGEVDVAKARIAAVSAVCELGATKRQIRRNAINEGLAELGHCSIDHCAGDPPAACPRDTALVETGEPAEADADALIEQEQLKETLKAEAKEEAKLELEEEAAAAEEAEAADEAAKE